MWEGGEGACGRVGRVHEGGGEDVCGRVGRVYVGGWGGWGGCWKFR